MIFMPFPYHQNSSSQVISNPRRMLSVSQQPLNVYQGQLRPIKPIRHHNVGRRSDDGGACNEASLKRSGKWSPSSLLSTTRSSASTALPSSPPTGAWVHPSAGIHFVSCSVSKPIVQLRELFQYIAGSQ